MHVYSNIYPFYNELHTYVEYNLNVGNMWQKSINYLLLSISSEINWQGNYGHCRVFYKMKIYCPLR